MGGVGRGDFALEICSLVSISEVFLTIDLRGDRDLAEFRSELFPEVDGVEVMVEAVPSSSLLILRRIGVC